MAFALLMHFKENPMSDGLVLTHTYFFHMAHILLWNDSDELVWILPPDTATA